MMKTKTNLLADPQIFSMATYNAFLIDKATSSPKRQAPRLLADPQIFSMSTYNAFLIDKMTSYQTQHKQIQKSNGNNFNNY